MSRTVTPQQSHQPTSTTNISKVPHEKIAQRAYEKWCKRGCQHGNDRQDWLEAEAELRVEMSRTGSMGTHQPQRR
jgi:hypothetical protein